MSTRAATLSGETSAAIAGLFGGIAAFDPQSGQWSEKLPGSYRPTIGSLPGIGGLGGAGKTDGGNPVALNDCLTDCNRRQYRGELTEEGWQNCTRKCKILYGPRQPGELVDPIYTTGCATCGLDDIPGCLSCAWAYIAHAGIEIGLVALALLGLYLWLK